MGGTENEPQPCAAHLRCLKDIFQLDGFRSNQYAAAKATLDGKDSLLILPTGAGKVLYALFFLAMR